VGETGEPVAPGVVGRVRVRSLLASMTDRPGSPWLTMGDLGRLDAHGRLHLLGRVGPVARLGGEFVDPGAVRKLLESLPGVRSATVEVVADDRYGQRLVAGVVPEAGFAADPQLWRTAVREALGPAAVPREVVVAVEPPALEPHPFTGHRHSARPGSFRTRPPHSQLSPGPSTGSSRRVGR